MGHRVHDALPVAEVISMQATYKKITSSVVLQWQIVVQPLTYIHLDCQLSFKKRYHIRQRFVRLRDFNFNAKFQQKYREQAVHMCLCQWAQQYRTLSIVWRNKNEKGVRTFDFVVCAKTFQLKT